MLRLCTFSYLIKPSSLSPHPTPVLSQQRQKRRMTSSSRRQEPTGAETARDGDTMSSTQLQAHLVSTPVNHMHPPTVTIEPDSDCDDPAMTSSVRSSPVDAPAVRTQNPVNTNSNNVAATLRLGGNGNLLSVVTNDDSVTSQSEPASAETVLNMSGTVV